MADVSRVPLVWPSGAWKMLRRLVRAWYAAEEGGATISQKSIAELAGIQQSRLSMNKPFLQAIGIVESEGIGLTENGKLLGLGLTNENTRVTMQALQSIVRTNPILRQLYDSIKGRGPIDRAEFEALVITITKQGRPSDYFGTGVGVLGDMLLESALVQMVEDKMRVSRNQTMDDAAPPQSLTRDEVKRDSPTNIGLKRIPIPVSAGAVWYVEVGESANQSETETFLNVQRMIFGIK